VVYDLIQISGTGFGYVVINGVRHEHDIVICKDQVSLRPKNLSAKYVKDYGHTPLSLEEIRYLLDACRDAEIVVIGSGYYGALPIPHEVFTELERRNIAYIVGETPKIVGVVNDLAKSGRRFLAILHTTC